MPDPDKNQNRRSLSHRLYDRIGLRIPLKVIDIFIAIVILVLVVSVVVGIFVK